MSQYFERTEKSVRGISAALIDLPICWPTTTVDECVRFGSRSLRTRLGTQPSSNRLIMSSPFGPWLLPFILLACLSLPRVFSHIIHYGNDTAAFGCRTCLNALGSSGAPGLVPLFLATTPHISFNATTCPQPLKVALDDACIRATTSDSSLSIVERVAQRDACRRVFVSQCPRTMRVLAMATADLVSDTRIHPLQQGQLETVGKMFALRACALLRATGDACFRAAAVESSGRSMTRVWAQAKDAGASALPPPAPAYHRHPAKAEKVILNLPPRFVRFVLLSRHYRWSR